MSLQSYRYTHNHEAGTLLIGLDDEPYLFEPQDGTAYPLSLDDEITLDTPEAALIAEADGLVGAWRDLCQSVADHSNPNAARQTLLECLDVMRQALDTGGSTDPAPALALIPAA